MADVAAETGFLSDKGSGHRSFSMPGYFIRMQRRGERKMMEPIEEKSEQNLALKLSLYDDLEIDVKEVFDE